MTAKGREGKMFQNVLLYLWKHQRVHDGNHIYRLLNRVRSVYFLWCRSETRAVYLYMFGAKTFRCC